MQNDFIIRHFNKSDQNVYQALAALHNFAYPEEKTSSIELRLADHLREGKYTCERFIAECNGSIAGVGCFEHWESFYHPHKYLLHIIVDPSYQKRGIGTALYRETIKQLEKHKPLMTLIWAQKNWDRSLRFAERNGFKKLKLKWNLALDLSSFEPEQFSRRLETVKDEDIEIKLFSEVIDDNYTERRFYELYIKGINSIETVGDTQIPSFNEFLTQKRENAFGLTFIAVYKGQFVGLWKLENTGGDSLFGGAMSVEKSYRRSGVGLALALHGCRHAKNLRYGRIIAHTDEHNTAVLNLTEKLGFIHLPAQILFGKEYESK